MSSNDPVVDLLSFDAWDAVRWIGGGGAAGAAIGNCSSAMPPSSSRKVGIMPLLLSVEADDGSAVLACGISGFLSVATDGGLVNLPARLLMTETRSLMHSLSFFLHRAHGICLSQRTLLFVQLMHANGCL